jgi:hypothetical protein
MDQSHPYALPQLVRQREHSLMELPVQIGHPFLQLR